MTEPGSLAVPVAGVVDRERRLRELFPPLQHDTGVIRYSAQLF